MFIRVVSRVCDTCGFDVDLKLYTVRCWMAFFSVQHRAMTHVHRARHIVESQTTGCHPPRSSLSQQLALGCCMLVTLCGKTLKLSRDVPGCHNCVPCSLFVIISLASVSVRPLYLIFRALLVSLSPKDRREGMRVHDAQRVPVFSANCRWHGTVAGY